MIRFDGVTVTHHEAAQPTLLDVDLTVPAGELCLVVGRTGSGKSTLLRAVNGLVPHFSGGALAGRVTVEGRDTREHPPRELADVVGFVGQDPAAGFVTDTVEEELAYALESLGSPAPVMRRRVEETLDLLGLSDHRSRPLESLSGGQQQRVAIGSALTAQPRVLVLDEPTSALDPGAAEEVLAALHRLVHDVGVTVLVAEHRLERVVQFADRVVHLHGSPATIVAGDPGTVLAGSPVAPPVVRLGVLLGWTPPPVSVRAARALALAHLLPEPAVGSSPSGPVPTATSEPAVGSSPSGPVPTAGSGGVRLEARGIVVRYPGRVAVGGVDLRVAAGEQVALMGRNGSGKSSLLWALQGSGRRHRGTVSVDGDDPARLVPGERRRRVALVPQEAADLLYLDTVDGECAQGDREAGAPQGTVRALLDDLVAGILGAAHPRDLSEGQRLALVLAVALAASPPVVLLDEPTRGLDQPAKVELAAVLARLADGGRAVVLATHDVEFVARFATRVVLLADGEVVADEPAATALTSSPLFAPQVAKVLPGTGWTTVDDVAAALARPANRV